MPAFSPTIIFIYSVITVCLFAYTYKAHTLDWPNKFLIVLFYFGITVLVGSAVSKAENFNAIAANCEVTEGKIVDYTPGDDSVIEFNFKTNDQSYSVRKNQDRYQKIPAEKPDLDIAYLVLYQKTDPDNSIILLHYPLIEDGDLDKYRAKFEQGIPPDLVSL